MVDLLLSAKLLKNKQAELSDINILVIKSAARYMSGARDCISYGWLENVSQAGSKVLILVSISFILLVPYYMRHSHKHPFSLFPWLKV